MIAESTKSKLLWYSYVAILGLGYGSVFLFKPSLDALALICLGFLAFFAWLTYPRGKTK